MNPKKCVAEKRGKTAGEKQRQTKEEDTEDIPSKAIKLNNFLRWLLCLLCAMPISAFLPSLHNLLKDAKAGDQKLRKNL